MEAETKILGEALEEMGGAMKAHRGREKEGLIVLFEPQCIGWQHERVNAGMLQQIAGITEEDILVYADPAHAEGIIQLAGTPENACAFPFQVPEPIEDDYSRTDYYVSSLEGLLSQYPQIHAIVQLSSHRGNIRAATDVAKRHPKVKFLVVLHAILEKVLCAAKQNGDVENFVECIDTASLCQNICFLSYSPHLRRFLSGKLKQETLDRFLFLHHTYPERWKSEKREHRKFTIGIIGQCNTRASHYLLKSVEWVPKIGTRYEVCSVGSRYVARFPIKNMVSMGIEEATDWKQMEGILESLDLVLIPYKKSQYRISASGVFADALYHRIPILMLDSPFLQYYNDRFSIGYQYHSILALRRKLIGLIRYGISETEHTRFEANFQMAIRAMESENRSALMDVLEISDAETEGN